MKFYPQDLKINFIFVISIKFHTDLMCRMIFFEQNIFWGRDQNLGGPTQTPSKFLINFTELKNKYIGWEILCGVCFTLTANTRVTLSLLTNNIVTANSSELTLYLCL